jgi:hypothetical protein
LGANSGDAANINCSDGDIRVEYHPNSGHEDKTFTFEEFGRAASPVATPHPPDPEPWLPFKTREDFEFAALAHEAGMSRKQVTKWINLFQRCLNIGKGSFTFSSFGEMRKTVLLASERLPKVGL